MHIFDVQNFFRRYTMKKYTVLALFFLVTFFAGGIIFAQQGGFTGPAVPVPAATTTMNIGKAARPGIAGARHVLNSQITSMSAN